MPSCTTAPYSDVDVARDDYCPSVKYLLDLGLDLSCAPNQFCPADDLTRADAAQFLGETIVQLAAGNSPRGACYRAPPTYCAIN